jgi:hypothetical protein
MTVAAPGLTWLSSRARGLWLLAEDGTVFTYGALESYGSLDGSSGPDTEPSSSPARSLVATVTGRGYWIVDDAGRIRAFGDAWPTPPLAGPLAAVAPVPGGAWVIDRAGTVTVLGEAPPPPPAPGVPFAASAPSGSWASPPSTGPEATVRAAAVADAGAGWLLSADGRVHPWGSAPWLGDPADLSAGVEAVGIAATPTGQGYWVCGRRGELFGFGDAVFEGSPATDLVAVRDVVAIDATMPGGYVLLTGKGAVLPFGAIDLSRPFHTTRPPDSRAPITGIAMVAEPSATMRRA